MLRYRHIKFQCQFLDQYLKSVKLVNNIKPLSYNFKKLNMSTASNTNSFEKSGSNKTMTKNNLPDWTRMVWVDCEMTGLDTKIDTLLEVAVIVTDSDLNIVAEGPNIVIHHPDKVLTSMNEWCIQHHGKSGLTQMVKDSTIRYLEFEDVYLGFRSFCHVK